MTIRPRHVVMMFVLLQLILVYPASSLAQEDPTPNPPLEAPSSFYEVSLQINRLRCDNAQEDRWISIDGDGDEVYMIYQVRIYDADGEFVEAGLHAWGIRRLKKNDIVSSAAFRPIRLTIPSDSSVEIDIRLLESDSYQEAVELIENVQDQAGEDGARLLAPPLIGDTTAYSELFDLVTGIELFGFLADEDELGRYALRFSSEQLAELSVRGISYQEKRDLRHSAFNNTWDYELKFAFFVQALVRREDQRSA
jgi:hypothetical protein